MKQLLFTCCIFSLLVTSNVYSQDEYENEHQGDYSQNGLEIQTRPLRIIFGSPNLGFEWVNNDNLGVNLDVGTQLGGILSPLVGVETNFYVIARGKFYLQPKYGSDGMYVGGYARYRYQGNTVTINNQTSSAPSVKASLGLATGYKWMSDYGILFDLGLGLGRDIIDNTGTGGTVNVFDGLLGVNLIGNATIGYRFNQI